MLKNNPYMKAYLNTIIKEDIDPQNNENKIDQFINDTLYNQIKLDSDKVSNWLQTIPDNLKERYFKDTIITIDAINDKNLFYKKVYQIIEALIDEWGRLLTAKLQKRQIHCYFGGPWYNNVYNISFNIYSILHSDAEYFSGDFKQSFPTDLTNWDDFVNICYNFINNYINDLITTSSSKDCLGNPIHVGDYIVTIKSNQLYFGVISEIKPLQLIINYSDKERVRLPKIQSFKLLDLSNIEQMNQWLASHCSVEI